jgi:hypothetical protein
LNASSPVGASSRLRRITAVGRRGLVVEKAPDRKKLTTLRTHFAYRIDRWDILGNTIIEHVAGIEDLFVAKAAYEAACQRSPGEMITLRQGGRIIEDSSKTRLA